MLIVVPKQPNFMERILEGFIRGQEIQQQQQLMEQREQALKQQKQRLELDAQAAQIQQQQEAQKQAQQLALFQQVVGAIGPGNATQIAGGAGNIGNAAAPAGADLARIQQTAATQLVESPEASPALARQAGNALNLTPGQTEVIREEITPPTELEQAQEKLEALRTGMAFNTAERIQAGELTLGEAASTQDLSTIVGLSELGVGPDVREIRRAALAKEGLNQELSKFFRTKAVEILDEANLEGEIPPGVVAKGLMKGFGALSAEEQQAVAPLREAMSGERLKAQAGVASAVTDDPSVRILLSSGQKLFEDGDEEGAAKVLDKAAKVAERRLGMKRSHPLFPIPTLTRKEKDTNVIGDLFRSLTGGAQPSAFEIATPEDLEVRDFVLGSFGGDVQAAFKEAQRNLKERGEELPEDQRARAEQIVERLRELIRIGVKDLGNTGN